MFHHSFIHNGTPDQIWICLNIMTSKSLWYTCNFHNIANCMRPIEEGGGVLRFFEVQIIRLDDMYLSLLLEAKRFVTLLPRPYVRQHPCECRNPLITGEITLPEFPTASLSLLSEDDAFYMFSLWTRKSSSLLSSLRISESNCSRRARHTAVYSILFTLFIQEKAYTLVAIESCENVAVVSEIVFRFRRFNSS